MKVRRGIFYGGFILLAVVSIISILFSSGLYNAQVNTISPGTISTNPCPIPVVNGETTTSTPTSLPDCSGGSNCEKDPPFDVAFDDQTTGAFGSGGNSMANGRQLSRLNDLIGLQVAQAQTGGNQLGESKNFEAFLRGTIQSAINEQKLRFTKTLEFLKNPRDWFNDQGHLDLFAGTFSSEITKVLTDPTLTYDARIREAQLKVPKAFTSAMEQFVYGKKVDHAEAFPSNRTASRTPVFGYTPNWTEWASGGLGSGNITIRYDDKTSGNNGSYTRCLLDIGLASGNSSNLVTGIRLTVSHGTTWSAGVLFNPGNRTVTLGYNKSF